MNSSKDLQPLKSFNQQVIKEYDQLSSKYSDELKSIKKKDLALFPKDFLLDEEKTNTYRALCTLSQSEASRGSAISSHRKYIGPIIVFFKKALNRVIEAQLKNQFLGIEACMSRLITNQAKLEVELKLSQSGQMTERTS